MKQEFHELVEAVRDLGMKLTGKPAPKCVRVSDPSNFPEKLERVQRALEAVDAAGALSDGESPAAPAPKDDPARLKEALDKILRLYQMRGGNLEEADVILRETLSIGDEAAASRRKEHATLPAFAPSRLKRKKGYKPRVNMYPDRPGEASLNDLRKIAFDLQTTTAILGSTVPRNEMAFARMQQKKLRPPPPPLPGIR